jgi:hypothetical protein
MSIVVDSTVGSTAIGSLGGGGGGSPPPNHGPSGPGGHEGEVSFFMTWILHALMLTIS